MLIADYLRGSLAVMERLSVFRGLASTEISLR